MADFAVSEASADAAACCVACSAMVVPALSELVAFRAAAATRGAYTAQVSTGEVLFAALERAPENFAPEDIAEIHTTLERLLTNISCRATQRDPNLRPLRVALASLKRRANELLPTRPRTKRPRSATPPRCALLEAHGPRHLCEHLCYFDFYEPARRRAAAQTPPASPAPAAASSAPSPRQHHQPRRPPGRGGRRARRLGCSRSCCGTGRGRSCCRASSSTRPRGARSTRSSAGCCANGPTRRRRPPPTPPPSRRSSARSASTAGAAARSSPSRRPSSRTAGRAPTSFPAWASMERRRRRSSAAATGARSRATTRSRCT